MNDLSPEARRLIAEARASDPSSEDAERVLAGILARASGAELAAQPAKAPPPSGAKAVKAFAVGGAIIATVAVVALVLRSELIHRPESVPVAIEAPAKSVPEPQPDLQQEHEAVAPPEKPIVAPKPRAPARNKDTLAAELNLIDRASAMLRGGEPARALVLLDQHARRFPDGVLREEAAGARVRALAALGRKDEARTLAARFEADYPRSALIPSVRRAIEEMR